MTASFSVTLHNILPESPSQGVQVPFQTIVMDPFRRPFTFGPTCCQVSNVSHIGLDSTEDVAGVFIGNYGEFLVMSENQFVILTPKQGQSITVGTALFPRAETHVIEVGKKGKGYRMRVGSCIMAYNFDSNSLSLKHTTLFLGSNQSTNDIYNSAQGAMAQSLLYFNSIWHAIAPYSDEDKMGKKIVIEAFNPKPPDREKGLDMKLVMNMPYKPPLVLATIPKTTSLPVVKAQPLESKENKRQKTLP